VLYLGDDYVADVDIILNVRHAEAPIASVEVYGPENVVVTFTLLEAQ
jgi:hypothetical protein